MATVVSPNSNVHSSDAWALVSNGLIINTILASVNDINQALSLGPNIYTAMDYLVDLTIQGQSASIGWSYNSQLNSFMPPTPPAPNWSDVVQSDFDAAASDITQIVTDSGPLGGSLSTQQIQNAFNAAIEDSESFFTPNQMALMNLLLNYVKSGG